MKMSFLNNLKISDWIRVLKEANGGMSHPLADLVLISNSLNSVLCSKGTVYQMLFHSRIF